MLPSAPLHGETVGAVLARLRETIGSRTPIGWDRLSNLERKKHVGAVAIHRELERVWASQPTLGKSIFAPRIIAEVKRLKCETIAECGLGMSVSELKRRKLCIDADRPCFAKTGRVGAKQKPLIVEELRAIVDECYLSQGQGVPATFSYTKAHADQLGICPGLTEHDVKKYIGTIPPAVVCEAREGFKQFEQEYVPWINRDKELAPWEVLVMDGRTANFAAQVTRPDGEIVAVRLEHLNLMDMFDRRVWSYWADGVTVENTLIGVKRILRVGTPGRIYCDNASVYYRSLGNAWTEQIAPGARMLGIKPQNSIPGNKRSRGVLERFHADCDGFDRTFADAYVGSSIDKRPEDAWDWIKRNVCLLPTIAQVNERWEMWLAARHDRRHRGRGMDGLSPDAKLARWREAHPDFNVPKHDPAMVDFAMAKFVGPKKVFRDGLHHDGETYADLELFKLKRGREVWMRIDPEFPAMVWVCEEDGRPILGTNGDPILVMPARFTDRTSEELAHARRQIAQLKKQPAEWRRATRRRRGAAVVNQIEQNRFAKLEAESTPVALPVRLVATPVTAAARVIAEVKEDAQARRANAPRKQRTEYVELD
ncbi:MAG: Mu transposase C-terminal domain-containing protein, partial [Vicinamibacterales bacterium]